MQRSFNENVKLSRTDGSTFHLALKDCNGLKIKARQDYFIDCLTFSILRFKRPPSLQLDAVRKLFNYLLKISV